MNRTDQTAIAARLQQTGSWSKKHLGQHFLVDGQVLESIVEAANLQVDDTVVEIGPGLGVLTEQLLHRVTEGRVLAFETDAQMIAILRADFPGLELVEGDVLKTATEALAEVQKYKIVANIPYNITTPLIRLFLEGPLSRRLESLTLLVQKEVGERLAAGPKTGERGYLSVLTQYYAEIHYVKTVSKHAFWPAPEVESAVIHLKVRPERLFPADQERAFLRFVHTGFIQKRKQLKNVLAGIRGISPAEMLAELTALGLPETVRAQELDLEQWKALFIQQTSGHGK